MDPVIELPGKPYPCGANWDGKGVNFSGFSENGEKIEILLYDSVEAIDPARIVTLTEKTASTETIIYEAHVKGLTRLHPENRIIAYLNFNDQTVEKHLPVTFSEKADLLINSSEKQWNGQARKLPLKKLSMK